MKVAWTSGDDTTNDHLFLSGSQVTWNYDSVNRWRIQRNVKQANKVSTHLDWDSGFRLELSHRVKVPTTYCVGDCNVNKTFQDDRTELVHNLYHRFIIILQLKKIKSQSVNSVINLYSILSPEFNFVLFYLRLSDGHKETPYFLEYGDGKSAGAQLTGAEQYEHQSLHSVQHSGVRTSLCRYLETWAGLQQL